MLLRALICFSGCILLYACTQYEHPNLQTRQLGWEPDRDLQPYLHTDSMIQTLQSLRSDRNRLDSLLDWTDMLKDYDEHAALAYANEAYRLAVEKGFRFSQALSMYYRALLKGGGQIRGENVGDALADAKISQRLLKSSDDELWRSRINGFLGVMYYRNRRANPSFIDTAKLFALPALEILERSNVDEQQLNYLKAQELLGLGNIYSRDSTKAIDFIERSLQSAERSGNQVWIAATWADRGNFYSAYHDFDAAGEAFLKSEAILTGINCRQKTGCLKNLLYTYQRMADLKNTQYYLSGGQESFFRESMRYLEKCKPFSRDAYQTYAIIGYNYDDKSSFATGYAPEADSAIIYYQRAIQAAGEDGVLEIMSALVENISKLCAKRDRLLQENCSVLFEDSDYYMQFINKYYTTLVDTVRNELQLSNERIRAFENNEQIALNKHRVRNLWAISGVSLLFASLIFLLLLQLQQKKRLQARMEALRAQINPHFMSNSLNAIEHLVNMNEREAASKYLIHFSRLTRKILSSSRESSTTLQDELQTLKHFLALEQLRFRDKLTYKIEVDPALETDRIEVPALILQPYIENAILHGIKPKPAPGCLLIKVSREDKYLVCTVQDDGIGREKARAIKASSVFKVQHVSQGMKITEERLQTMGKVKGSNIDIIDLYNDQGAATGTKVVIKFPFKLRKQE